MQPNTTCPRIPYPLRKVLSGAGLLALTLILQGCTHPSITAVNLNNPKEPKGIPYYLPKPYLIVSKNIRYIPTPTVGLTATVPIPSSFDPSFGGNGSTNGGTGGKPAGTNQTSKSPGTPTNSSPGKAVATASSTNPPPATGTQTPSTGGKGAAGSTNAGTAYGSQVLGPASIAVVPPASISDGLVPQEFYTYQIVYLPDLTQKYGLRIKGGVGEFRATENLVNGWMHTGPGPLYMRDSSTSQSVAAWGGAVADVGGTLGQVALSAFGIPTLPGAAKTGPGSTSASAVQTANPTNKALETAAAPVVSQIHNYAEICVFEPVLITNACGEKQVRWRQMTGLPSFARDWIELERAASAAPSDNGAAGSPAADGTEAANAIKTSLKTGANAGKKWQVQDIQATSNPDAKTLVVKVKVQANGEDHSTFESAAKAAADQWLKDKGYDWKSQVVPNYVP